MAQASFHQDVNEFRVCAFECDIGSEASLSAKIVCNLPQAVIGLGILVSPVWLEKKKIATSN